VGAGGASFFERFSVPCLCAGLGTILCTGLCTGLTGLFLTGFFVGGAAGGGDFSTVSEGGAAELINGAEDGSGEWVGKTSDFG